MIELFHVVPRNRGYMDQRIRCEFGHLPPMVGYAATAAFRSDAPPQGGDAYGSMDKQLEQFAKLPGPAVVVFQDLDSPSISATFGEVMCSTYRAFGSAGLITSGTGRDIDQVRALDYPIFIQGSAPRSQLLARFRSTPHAVLFATSSFWQGVDVVGEALSCVIVDKLPFASPADPLLAARIDAIRARGGEPFGEYQVPLAILALQQGLGRLIRHRQDRGVLAVLDPRLRTKGYGRRFIGSLPPAPIVAASDIGSMNSQRRQPAT